MKLLLKGQLTMTEACRRFGISRKTGYKIKARHAELGMAGLGDASRAPKSHPNQTPPEVEAAILRVRKAHPTWGSKKILCTLDRERLETVVNVGGFDVTVRGKVVDGVARIGTAFR